MTVFIQKTAFGELNISKIKNSKENSNNNNKKGQNNKKWTKNEKKWKHKKMNISKKKDNKDENHFFQSK